MWFSSSCSDWGRTWCASLQTVMAGRGEGLRTWFWHYSSLLNSLVCLELNQQAAVAVLSDYSPADRACFACPLQSARQRLAELVVPLTLCHARVFDSCAWTATSSWRYTCWPLIAHVCHLLFFFFSFFFKSCILIAFELPFFITSVSFVSGWTSEKVLNDLMPCLNEAHTNRRVWFCLCVKVTRLWVITYVRVANGHFSAVALRVNHEDKW